MNKSSSFFDLGYEPPNPDYCEKFEKIMTHNLPELKYIFYKITSVNVPRDLLNDSVEYQKTNITHLIIYFWNSPHPLNDKLFKCSKCNEWRAYESLKRERDKFKPSGICVLCFTRNMRGGWF